MKSWELREALTSPVLALNSESQRMTRWREEEAQRISQIWIRVLSTADHKMRIRSLTLVVHRLTVHRKWTVMEIIQNMKEDPLVSLLISEIKDIFSTSIIQEDICPHTPRHRCAALRVWEMLRHQVRGREEWDPVSPIQPFQTTRTFSQCIIMFSEQKKIVSYKNSRSGKSRNSNQAHYKRNMQNIIMWRRCCLRIQFKILLEVQPRWVEATSHRTLEMNG